MRRFAFAAFAAVSLACALFASNAASAQATAFNLCTGGEKGNYFAVGQTLKKLANFVNPIPTAGSTDNLDRIMNDTCDGAFVQSDALQVYTSNNARTIPIIQRIGILYPEHVHMLCNRKLGLDRVVDLNQTHTLALGDMKSGARKTWDGFILADKKRYSNVKTDDREGFDAFLAVADGSQVQCTIWVGALGSASFKEDASKLGDGAVLISSYDRDMANTAKDSRGNPVYGVGEIPAGMYPQIQPKGFGWGTKPVDTITVDALFIVSNKWRNANKASYDTVLRAFVAAKPAINDLIKPKN